MQKVYCLETGYTARIANKWLGTLGAPTCPCCGNEMEIDWK